jgi:hypothetical protein
VTATKKIARMTEKLESLYDSHGNLYDSLPRLALVHPTLFLVEAWRAVGNQDKTIEYAFKLMRNFGIRSDWEEDKLTVKDTAGLVNIEVLRALKYVAETFRAKGEHSKAEKAERLGRVWYTCIAGCDVGAGEFFKE